MVLRAMVLEFDIEQSLLMMGLQQLETHYLP
jgi:hypothetical protein